MGLYVCDGCIVDPFPISLFLELFQPLGEERKFGALNLDRGNKG